MNLFDEERAFWCLALSFVRGVGSIIAKRLIELFGSAKGVFEASREKLEYAVGQWVAHNIKNFQDWGKVEFVLSTAKRLGMKIITIEDDVYPKLLREIPDPPICLFVKGEIIPDALCVAFVGTRRPSSYGIEVTRYLVRSIAPCGVCITSGLAYGIDAVAHKSAVESGGITWAVLGSSLDRIYPSEHYGLAKQILDSGGALISEYPPPTPPAPENFPRRNRIISGLSKAVVVVEAPEKSGALITAYLALEQGRDVFAVPGNITSEKSKGANKLIKQGAYLVDEPEDILQHVVPHLKFEKKEEFGFAHPFLIKKEEEKDDLTEEQKKVLSVLDSEKPMHVDDIIRKTGLEPSEVLSALFQLEIMALVVSEGMGHWRKAKVQ